MKHRPLRVSLLVALALSAMAFQASAQIELSLPLEGYYRPGRYIPVRVSARSSAQPAQRLTISADGAMPTALELRGGLPDAVVPLLVVDPPLRQLRWSAPPGAVQPVERPLYALAPDERLVASTMIDVDVASQLFPGHSLIHVKVDTATLSGSAAVAWETLDALLLSASDAARLDAGFVAELLSAGVMLAVQSEQAPDSYRPWRQVAEWWVLAYQPIGPAGAVDEAVYLPTYAWNPGQPPAFRRFIVWIAVLFCLAVMGLALWRRRWSVAGIVLLAAGTTVLLFVWGAGQSSLRQAGGSILVMNDGLLQRDRWLYQTSPRHLDATLPWAMLSRPVFASARHMRETSGELRCDSQGRPVAFAYHLAPGARLTFMSRSIGREERIVASPALPTSALLPLARQVYLRPGWTITGQQPIAAHHDETTWPAIVIEAEN